MAQAANIWLDDLSSVDELSVSILASVALEDCLLHFGDDVSVSDDDSLDCDELVDVGWVELPDLVGPPQVARLHNYEDAVESVVLGSVEVAGSEHAVGLLVLISVEEELLEAVGSYQIEDGDDVGGVVLDLSVKLLVVLVDVIAVDL